MRHMDRIRRPAGRERAVCRTCFTDLKSRVPWQMKYTDDDGKPIVPFLLLDYIEWEGPVVESWPTTAHQQIFFGGESATKDPAYARLILARFADAASSGILFPSLKLIVW